VGRDKPGTREGFTDDSFSVEMSRGYSTVVPRVRKDFNLLHEDGPVLKEGVFSTYLGNCRHNYWRGRTIIFPMAYINLLAWHLNIIPDYVRKDIGEPDKIFCALPSYVACFTTLTLFSRTNEGFKPPVNYSRLLNLNKHLVRLRLPTNIREAETTDIYYAKVTPDTHPGIITRKLAQNVLSKIKGKVKNIRKGNLIFSCVNDLINNWEHISCGRVGKTIGTYCIGSREKIQKLDFGSVCETRPLWIPEMCDLLLGSTWLELFKEYWQKHGLFKSEIWLGHSDNNLRYYRRLELDIKYKYAYEFDGKLWDSSVLSLMIQKAFDVYASCFTKNKTVVNHFRFLCDTMVLKRVIMHNGNTFLITSGVPSGHAWTSHINSMVNWLLWTSTIHNCPVFCLAFREDYELQIMGDDVCLHSNIKLSEEDRHKISVWMLANFNYIVTDDTKQARKDEVKDTISASSFLKRFVNAKGNLETKIMDIWKKLLFGPEYSGTRSSRLTYLLRRIDDFAIYDETNVRRVSIYISFIEVFENFLRESTFNKTLRKTHFLYKILFYLSNAFTSNLVTTWNIFLSIVPLDLSKMSALKDKYDAYIKLIYKRNYWTYDDSSQYVDYWKERKQSVTVSKLLRNYDEVPIYPSVSVFKKLHGPFKKFSCKKKLRAVSTRFRNVTKRTAI
jgi:hypothetical protein